MWEAVGCLHISCMVQVQVDSYECTQARHEVAYHTALHASGHDRLLQDCDIYLMDDVLAAVDAPVAKSLLRDVICGPLLSGKTRIVCTHSLQCAWAANTVVRLVHGRVAAAGTPAEVLDSTEQGWARRLEAPAPAMQQGMQREVNMGNSISETATTAEQMAAAESETIDQVQPDSAKEAGQQDAEAMFEGHVRWEVYRTYMRAVGWGMTALILASLLLMQV